MISDTIRERVLNPILDANALNRQQQRLIANSTPEIDSIAEAFIDVAAENDPALRRRKALHGMALLKQLVAANRAEGECERQAAGELDHFARSVRDAELNGGAPPKEWSAKRVARETRDALAVLGQPFTSDEQRHDAMTVVQRVIAECPRHVLLSDRTAYELSTRKFRLLAELASTVAVAA
jgi:hypothetical protein